MSVSVLSKAGPIVGRLLVGGVYVINGIGLIGAFGPVSQLMATKGVLASSALLGITIAAWLVGGAMLVFGYRVQLAGLFLAAITVPVTLYIHGPWGAAPAEFQNELNHFLKNIAIIGALVYIALADGPRRANAS
jgi:putative oxidoreductase